MGSSAPTGPAETEDAVGADAAPKELVDPELEMSAPGNPAEETPPHDAHGNTVTIDVQSDADVLAMADPTRHMSGVSGTLGGPDEHADSHNGGGLHGRKNSGSASRKASGPALISPSASRSRSQVSPMTEAALTYPAATTAEFGEDDDGADADEYEKDKRRREKKEKKERKRAEKEARRLSRMTGAATTTDAGLSPDRVGSVGAGQFELGLEDDTGAGGAGGSGDFEAEEDEEARRKREKKEKKERKRARRDSEAVAMSAVVGGEGDEQYQHHQPQAAGGEDRSPLSPVRSVSFHDGTPGEDHVGADGFATRVDSDADEDTRRRADKRRRKELRREQEAAEPGARERRKLEKKMKKEALLSQAIADGADPAMLEAAEVARRKSKKEKKHRKRKHDDDDDDDDAATGAAGEEE